MMMNEEAAKRLRAPFDQAQIGQLPKAGTTLDYVGHAAVTDRLLEVDPEWTWEPVSFAHDGAPLIGYGVRDASMWIRLTVCGTTRLGVGIVKVDAFELEKQLISDALRNAAMRFGVALDLWSKQDLHDTANPAPSPPVPAHASKANIDAFSQRVSESPESVRQSFAAWKDDQGFPWPWPQSALIAMQRKFADLLIEQAEIVGDPGDSDPSSEDGEEPSVQITLDVTEPPASPPGTDVKKEEAA